MALTPTIPTSFVPHPSTGPRKFVSDFSNAFRFFAYGVLGITFILAIGVFFYGRILHSSQLTKDTALKTAEAEIDSKTVAEFVRLRDSLNSGKILLEKHVAFSGFFLWLEKTLPSTVRFASIHLIVDSNGVTRVDGNGVAKNLNALAAASNSFADDGRIKDAIFSNLGIGKFGQVSFTLGATLDPSIIVFSP